MIAGFGFSTIQRRDLSDLDDILSRIEDLGATHAELSLGGADLVCGGRLLSHRVDRLARICARHRLAYTAHGPLTANFMDPVHLDAYKAAVAALLEVCGAVGATALVQHSERSGAQGGRGRSISQRAAEPWRTIQSAIARRKCCRWGAWGPP